MTITLLPTPQPLRAIWRTSEDRDRGNDGGYGGSIAAPPERGSLYRRTAEHRHERRQVGLRRDDPRKRHTEDQRLRR